MSQYLLALELREPRFELFNQLLQRGVTVRCRVGCSLGDLLEEQWGIDAEYVRQRVTTIFLNSRAIDDVTTAMVGPGATIALSGAMPGLVGATMRRGGHLAAMRGSMTYHEPVVTEGEQVAMVRVKLFNLVLGELGPGFLQRGILLSGAELAAFFREQPEAFAVPRVTARLNSLPVVPALLADDASFSRIDAVRLTVDARCKV
jgi:hypothetical protein